MGGDNLHVDGEENMESSEYEIQVCGRWSMGLLRRRDSVTDRTVVKRLLLRQVRVSDEAQEVDVWRLRTFI